MSTTSTERSDGKTKKRSDMACTNCRRRKLKCENKDSTPPCKRCHQDSKEPCEFLPVSDDHTDRNSKTPSGSRGSSEDRKSNSQLAMSPPTSHAPQVTPPSLRRTDRPPNSGITVPPQPHYSPPYFSSGQPMRPDPPNYHNVPQHLYGDSQPTPESPQVHWPNTQYTAPNGHYDDNMSQMPSYTYLSHPTPPYSQPLPDHHPRAIPSAPPFYSHHLSAPHIPQAPNYSYYTAPQQPSGLVVYPTHNNIPHGHPGDNSHFCGPYPR